MRQNRLWPLFVLIVFVAAACGTYAEPPPNSATLAAQQEVTQAVIDAEAAGIVLLPTNTPLPPTPTPPSPTETPTPEPAEEVAEEEPVIEEEEEAVDEEAPQLTAEEANLIFFIQEFSNPANGERLFNATHSVEMADGTIGDWACVTCHMVNNDDRGVGPGVYSLALRAGDRVPGQPAELYIYESIVDPNAYIVESYSPNVMPIGYADIFTEQELYDISAYLMTLTGAE